MAMIKNRIYDEIRKKAKISRTEFAAILGITQSNLHYYEHWGSFPRPQMAWKIIDFATSRGIKVRWEDIYPRHKMGRRRGDTKCRPVFMADEDMDDSGKEET